MCIFLNLENLERDGCNITRHILSTMHMGDAWQDVAERNWCEKWGVGSL